MKKNFLQLLFLISYSVFSQNPTEDAKVYNYILLAQKEWKYFELKAPLEGEIIVHAKCVKTNRKSISECMAMSIVKTQVGDTIRVLSLSNYKEYLIGQKIKITPSKKPVRKTHIPFMYKVDPITNKPKPMLEYDRTTLNTTWGIIE